MFDDEQGRGVPGQGSGDPGRFGVRKQFLAGPGNRALALVAEPAS